MTTIGEKADHVRAAIAEDRQTSHHCHWPGCTETVPPAAWGCKRHWYKLPQYLRTKIWRAYRPGQETTKTPSPTYVAVAREVQDWIATNVNTGQGKLL